MLRKIITLNKVYFVDWTPEEVCQLLRKEVIRADSLIQTNKTQTKRLVRDLFLLACRASLNSIKDSENKAILLRNYAKSIKQTSHEYEQLFRRQIMTKAVSETESQFQVTDDSEINNIDRMQARLYYLTTQFSAHPCRHLAGHIIELLTQLCKHPHIELLPAQHYIYSQSLNFWRSRLISCAEPKSKAELH